MCVEPCADWWHVKVRILATPRERELDGVSLDLFLPGMVRDVSSSLGAWLIAQGYALSEMRRMSPVSENQSGGEDRRRPQRR